MEYIKHQLSKVGLRTKGSAPEVPESILAFTTITTMLSYINRARSFTDPIPTSIVKSKRRELRVLNALATVLVSDAGGVAVTVQPDIESGLLEIMVCVHMARLLEDATPIQGRGLLQRVWNCLFNLRKDSDVSLVPTIDDPTIVDPSRPSDLEKTSLEKYIEDGP